MNDVSIGNDAPPAVGIFPPNSSKMPAASGCAREASESRGRKITSGSIVAK